MLSSNVIWHPYRLIAETKNFRFVYPSYVFYMRRRNGLAIYYSKYITERYKILLQIPRILRLFTINDHISDNSVQINLKFTFTAYEYNEYILLSYLIFIYTYQEYIYITLFISS